MLNCKSPIPFVSHWQSPCSILSHRNCPCSILSHQFYPCPIVSYQYYSLAARLIASSLQILCTAILMLICGNNAFQFCLGVLVGGIRNNGVSTSKFYCCSSSSCGTKSQVLVLKIVHQQFVENSPLSKPCCCC